jgi:hypothetical protein
MLTMGWTGEAAAASLTMVLVNQLGRFFSTALQHTIHPASARQLAPLA